MTVKTLSVTFKYTKPHLVHDSNVSSIHNNDQIIKLIKDEIKLENINENLKQEQNDEDDQQDEREQKDGQEIRTTTESQSSTPIPIRSTALRRIVNDAYTVQDKTKQFSELYNDDHLTTSLSYLQDYTKINETTELEWLQHASLIAEALSNWRRLYKLLDQRKRQIKREQREGDGSGDQEDTTHGSDINEKESEEAHSDNNNNNNNYSVIVKTKREALKGKGKGRDRRSALKELQ